MSGGGWNPQITGTVTELPSVGTAMFEWNSHHLLFPLTILCWKGRGDGCFYRSTWMGLRDVWIAGKILLLGVPARVCQEGISVWMCRLSKALPHQCSGHPPICWGTEENKQAGEEWTCSSCLSWDIHLVPLGIGTPGAQAFRLRREFTPLASLVFELGWTSTTTFLGL